MIRSLLAIAAVAVLAAGCATVPPPVHGPQNLAAWHTRHQRLLHISRWHVLARAGSTGLFAWSGSLNWHQKNGVFDIIMSGPLGMGGVQLKGTLKLVRIRSDGKTYYTTHPNRFLQRNLGVALPVKGLRYWSLGVPVPGEPAEVRVDQKGRLVKLQQDHWTLRYTKYTNVDGYSLPTKIDAKHGDVHLRMIVQKWEDVS